MTAARREAQTRSASASDAQAYLDKSRDFLRAAEDSLELGNHVAAAGNAVHAGIGAADVVILPCCCRAPRASWADAIGGHRQGGVVRRQRQPGTSPASSSDHEPDARTKSTNS
jgi:hypothetical protein